MSPISFLVFSSTCYCPLYSKVFVLQFVLNCALVLILVSVLSLVIYSMVLTCFVLNSIKFAYLFPIVLLLDVKCIKQF